MVGQGRNTRAATGKPNSRESDRRVLFSRAVKILFAVSGAAMTALLSCGGSLLFAGIGTVCSLAICWVLAFRFHVLERVYARIGWIKLAAAFCFSALYGYVSAQTFGEKTGSRIAEWFASFDGIPAAFTEHLGRLLPVLVGVAAWFALFTLFYAFIDRFCRFAADWRRGGDAIELWYLAVCAAAAVLALSIIYSVTNIFYSSGISYDVVYTTDSTILVDSNAYLNLCADQNDIRQPLFGLFSMPFAVAAMLVSKLLFFVPNGYPIALGVVQILLMAIAGLMLARLMRLSGGAKILFLILISVTYPALLFALNMEQYVFATFWVILLVYFDQTDAADREFCYIAATGSLLTNGVLFPLLLRARGLWANVKALLFAAIKLLVLLIVFGRLQLLRSAVASIADLLSFAGAHVGFENRLLQFFNFVAACFARPAAGVDVTSFPHVSYQLEPVRALNFAGAALLAAVAAGFALNWRDRFARICAGWVAFSFALLCLVGWGTSENGLILYTLYFSWAYVSLAFLLVEKALQRWKRARYAAYAAGIAALVWINLPGIYELIRFGIQYYPVR